MSKKNKKSIEELTKSFEEFMKDREENPDHKEDFDRAIKKSSTRSKDSQDKKK